MYWAQQSQNQAFTLSRFSALRFSSEGLFKSKRIENAYDNISISEHFSESILLIIDFSFIINCSCNPFIMQL